MCVSMWCTVTGEVSGRDSGASSVPPVHTWRSASSGIQRLTGFSMRKCPSSYSIISATDVIGLVME